MEYDSLHKNYGVFSKDFLGLRYLPYSALESVLKDLDVEFVVIHEGLSELGKPIQSINFGCGNQRILIWSQMHGNETTTTKSLIDFLNVLSSDIYLSFREQLFESCTIKIIPMLNPDGADSYSRYNANSVDLNRDATVKSQKETQLFFNVVEKFKPDFCFNLHGQRTIFSAGLHEFPATISFLAPSYNTARDINQTRQTAMQLINIAFQTLTAFIPKQIARYDDTYNEKCFGDALTQRGIPTILFEAGHYQNDYTRDQTRKYITLSLISILESICNNTYTSLKYDDYLHIPENKKCYCDIIVKNVKNLNGKCIGIEFNETLVSSKIDFVPVIKYIGELDEKFAHTYLDANHKDVYINSSSQIKIDEVITSFMIGSDKALGLLSVS